MERIKLLNKDSAPEKAQDILNEIEQNTGKIINIFKIMANSPAVLKTYFAIDNALKEKTLDPAIAERISLIVSAVDDCEYCTTAHSYLAKNVLSEDEISNARQGKSSNEKAQAAMDFATAVVKKAGKVSDEELQKVKSAGFSDGEVLEIITIVALNFFTNSINNVSRTPVDFPKLKD